ncbi:MAG: hypothetical protein EBX61_05545 [Betaproteobacteria bacterium]|nr:hypothetical protein [Betaproteobacteria bacterium]
MTKPLHQPCLKSDTFRVYSYPFVPLLLVNPCYTIQAKERLLGIHREAGAGCRFIHNRQLRMDLNDAAFAKAFFGIWLDPRTTEPALRKSLIGEA